MESSLPVELVPNLNRIAHGIELELELMQKNHENPSPDSNPSLELIQPYFLPTLSPFSKPTLIPQRLHASVYGHIGGGAAYK